MFFSIGLGDTRVSIERKPVLIGEQTAALITLFHKERDCAGDWAIADLVDPYETAEEAARQFVEFLDDHWTPAFLMALRRAITAKLAKHDRQFGTQFAGEFDALGHIQRQIDWSREMFGPGKRTKGVCDHIRKELIEIEADPDDTEEWIDVVILGIDGAWRSGASAEQILATYVKKMSKNFARKWPDWRTRSEDEAIEHISGQFS